MKNAMFNKIVTQRGWEVTKLVRENSTKDMNGIDDECKIIKH